MAFQNQLKLLLFACLLVVLAFFALLGQVLYVGLAGISLELAGWFIATIAYGSQLATPAICAIPGIIEELDRLQQKT